jgi:hypothetical protein
MSHDDNDAVDLQASAEELEDTAQPGLSTAGSFSTAGTFIGGTMSSAGCFSTASS